ncbi:hypothetical protein ACWEQL_13040 [Kitasatospora sp. NPDC004240]
MAPAGSASESREKTGPDRLERTRSAALAPRGEEVPPARTRPPSSPRPPPWPGDSACATTLPRAGPGGSTGRIHRSAAAAQRSLRHRGNPTAARTTATGTIATRTTATRTTATGTTAVLGTAVTAAQATANAFIAGPSGVSLPPPT